MNRSSIVSLLIWNLIINVVVDDHVTELAMEGATTKGMRPAAFSGDQNFDEWLSVYAAL